MWAQPGTAPVAEAHCDFNCEICFDFREEKWDIMVVRTLKNLENLEMSGKNKMVDNLEKSGNFLSLLHNSAL